MTSLPHPPAAHPASQAAAMPWAQSRPAPLRWDGAQRLLVALWVLTLFDPQWFVASRGLGIALRVVTLFYLAMLGVMVLGIPTHRAWSRRWQWYVPFLAFIFTGAVTVPFAVNNGFARDGLRVYFLYWVLITSSLALINSPRRAELLLRMYGLQFVWWALWGGTTGQVLWHHSLDNHDAFGAFMVGGITMCFFLGMASSKGWFRNVMLVAAGLAAMGVVASYARGAFLAAVAAFGVMWLRSHRKGATLLAGIGFAIIVVIAAVTIHPPEFFWNEISSAFSEGNTAGTGDDRWQLWTAAWRVFMDHPVLGVGLRNVGAYAAGIFKPGELGGMYAYNPGFLYGRSLHNIHLTILSEQGILGLAAFVWILVDFWRRNARLRSRAAGMRWAAMGGALQLKPIALGLELGMVALLLTGLLYPMLNIHWFFTMLALNLLLDGLVRRGEGLPAPPRPPAVPVMMPPPPPAPGGAAAP